MGKTYSYREHILPCRAALAERFPAAFMPKRCDAKRPLKIGIHRDVVERMKDFPRRIIKLTLDDYCSGPKYTRAMAAGAQRVDLDGNPAGKVTFADAAFAKAKQAELEARRAPRRAAVDVAGAVQEARA